MIKTKYYGYFFLQVNDYKENGKYQFTSNTPILEINTDLEFNTPEEAFQYSDKILLKSFKNIIKQIQKQKKD